MSLKYNGRNIVLAKNLRKNATPWERHLWYDFLARCEVRFQRQKAIDEYIVDFYCHRAKLVVELDGGQHYTEEERRRDDQRTKVLTELGLKVLRFSNLDVDREFRAVCELIDAAVKAQMGKGLWPGE